MTAWRLSKTPEITKMIEGAQRAEKLSKIPAAWAVFKARIGRVGSGAEGNGVGEVKQGLLMTFFSSCCAMCVCVHECMHASYD